MALENGGSLSCPGYGTAGKSVRYPGGRRPGRVPDGSGFKGVGGTLWGISPLSLIHIWYSKWCYEDLPIIPEKWKYTVAPDKKDQYEVLVSLMNRPDVESLVCATDAGREGELIFRLVYDHAGCTKPFERLWISSMEDSAIREGFENLRPGAEYDLLYEAALCRAKADWPVSYTHLDVYKRQMLITVWPAMTSAVWGRT